MCEHASGVGAAVGSEKVGDVVGATVGPGVGSEVVGEMVGASQVRQVPHAIWHRLPKRSSEQILSMLASSAPLPGSEAAPRSFAQLSWFQGQSIRPVSWKTLLSR